MIAPAAVDAFLARPLRDSAKAKLFTDAALDRKLARLDPPPDFHTTPRRHQKVCFLLGVKYSAYLLFLDMGLGKSKVVLDLYAYDRRLRWCLSCGTLGESGKCCPSPRVVGGGLRCLVLVPGSANLGQWGEQVRTHTPHLSYCPVDAVGSAERLLQVRGESDVVAITYAGFLSLVCQTVKKRKGKTGWALSPKKLREFTGRFGFVAFDESTAFKNKDSLTARACRQLAKLARYKYALTGTPFGKEPVEELWPQFHVIDGGETLGPSVGFLREVFCTKKLHPFTGFPVYAFDRRKKKALARMIRHRSVRYRVEECEDLPPVVPSTRRVVFPAETWAYYERIVAELTDAQREGKFKALDNAWMRMRQLTAGYLTVKDPEGGRHTVRFRENPKLDALLDWLGEVPLDRKAIVFCEYRMTGDIICEALRARKIPHARLYSKTRDKSGEVERFLRGKPRVLVSSSAGAFGGNWQAANYTFWFESPTPPITRKQEERRNYRMGQTRTVFHNDLVVRGSVDERILASLAEGRDLFKDIAEGRAAPLVRKRLRKS